MPTKVEDSNTSSNPDFDATRFEWEHFVLAGDVMNEREEARGNVQGDAFGSPDGLHLEHPAPR